MASCVDEARAEPVDLAAPTRISAGDRFTRLRLDYGGGALLTLGLLTFGYFAWLALGGGKSEYRGLVSDAVTLPFGLLVGLLALRTSVRLRPDRRAFWAWLTLSAAFLAFWLGDVLWLRNQIIFKSVLFPSWADAGYLFYYPLLLGGLFLITRPKAGWAGRLKFGLNAATTLVGGGLAIWYFIPTLAGGAGGFGPALGALYPVGDLLLVLGIATLTLRKVAFRSRPALFALLAGIAFGLVADLAYGYQVPQGFHHGGGLADGGYLLSWFFLALAAELEFRSLRTEPDSARFRTREMRKASLLPYLATLIGSAVLLWVVRGKLSTPEGQVAAAVAALIVLAVAHQVTAGRENTRLREQNAARRTEERFESLVKNTSDIVTVTDVNSTISYQTPSLRQVLGYEPATLAGTRLLDLVHPEDAPFVVSFLAELGSRPGASRQSAWRMLDSKGGWRPTETVGTNLLGDARVRGLVLTTRDISERKAFEEQLTRQAFHDPLTGLPNRALFSDRLAHAFARADRQGFSVAVLLLDLDDFKNVNDSLGHAEGDRLLVLAAERLQNVLRGSDTAARLGGDEFVIVLENGPSLSRPDRVAERVLAHLREPYRLSAAEVFVSASIGVAIREPRGDTGEEVLRNADTALYAAKSQGKDCYRLFKPQMFEVARVRLELEAELRRALECREITVHYQPILSTMTGQIVGFEALARWEHPTRGLLLPASFIALAEETGLIVPLGYQVLEQACHAFKEWDTRYPHLRLRLTINLSPRQLRAPEVVEKVIKIVGSSGLRAERLVLEITESVLVEDDLGTLSTLQTLREAGISLAIDDFGTGYSSLSYLKRYPVDILKIAKPFVDSIGETVDGAALASAVVSLAKSLRLEVVAEAVEKPEQLETLAALDCDMWQGSYFSLALPSAQISTLLMRHPGMPSTVVRPAATQTHQGMPLALSASLPGQPS